MLSQTIGELLPVAAAVALSPIPMVVLGRHGLKLLGDGPGGVTG